jgi:hypothetical protein
MSSGRLGMSGQLSLPQQVKATLQIEMMGEDPGMQFAAFMLQKDFSDSHFQYMFQGVHMLSFMQTVNKDFTAGIQGMFIVSIKIISHNFFSPNVETPVYLTTLVNITSARTLHASTIPQTRCNNKKSSCSV